VKKKGKKEKKMSQSEDVDSISLSLTPVEELPKSNGSSLMKMFKPDSATTTSSAQLRAKLKDRRRYMKMTRNHKEVQEQLQKEAMDTHKSEPLQERHRQRQKLVSSSSSKIEVTEATKGFMKNEIPFEEQLREWSQKTPEEKRAAGKLKKLGNTRINKVKIKKC
jgi:hypothetical protein